MIAFFQNVKERYSQTVTNVATLLLGNEWNSRQHRIIDAVKLYGPKVYFSTIGRPLLYLSISIGTLFVRKSTFGQIAFLTGTIGATSSFIYRMRRLNGYLDFVGKSEIELLQLSIKEYSDFNTGMNDALNVAPSLTWNHSYAYMAGNLSNEVDDQNLIQRVLTSSTKRATQQCRTQW